jgi:hypothetical protein
MTGSINDEEDDNNAMIITIVDAGIVTTMATMMAQMVLNMSSNLMTSRAGWLSVVGYRLSARRFVPFLRDNAAKRQPTDNRQRREAAMLQSASSKMIPAKVFQTSIKGERRVR